MRARLLTASIVAGSVAVTSRLATHSRLVDDRRVLGSLIYSRLLALESTVAVVSVVSFRLFVDLPVFFSVPSLPHRIVLFATLIDLIYEDA
jgi:hypothetical protein